ncbi:hypothetical protein CR513_25646, partial [Mucuna pruriens]
MVETTSAHRKSFHASSPIRLIGCDKYLLVMCCWTVWLAKDQKDTMFVSGTRLQEQYPENLNRHVLPRGRTMFGGSNKPSRFSCSLVECTLSGTFNWVAVVKDAAKNEIVIISVDDMGKETCRQLFLPEGVGFVDLKLGVLRDSLCLSLYLQIDDYKLPPMLSPLCMFKNDDIFMTFESDSEYQIIVYNHQKDGYKVLAFLPRPS